MTTRRRFLCASLAAGFAQFACPGLAVALQAGQPSRTARGAALHRAAHQLLEVPRVFDDPLALRIFGAQGVAWLGRNLDRYRSESARAMRAFLVMRSRYAEDRLAQAVRAGAQQYVVLGAGLDTFAYRNPHRALRVFEVDHPTTQAWKRETLKDRDIEVPRTLAYASVDFERQTLADGLRAAGFRAQAPAFVSWLGVTIYLTREAVMGTLRYAASLARGSEIVFDIGLPANVLDDAQRRALEAASARVAGIGEPWLTFFEPGALAAELRAFGYRQLRVFGPQEANARYFAGRSDGFRLRGAGLMISAQV